MEFFLLWMGIYVDFHPFLLLLHDFLDFCIGVVKAFGTELDELLGTFEISTQGIEVELLVFHFLDDAFQFAHRIFVFDCFHNC